jgi:hypothetical protein
MISLLKNQEFALLPRLDEIQMPDGFRAGGKVPSIVEHLYH